MLGPQGFLRNPKKLDNVLSESLVVQIQASVFDFTQAVWVPRIPKLKIVAFHETNIHID